MKKTMKYKIIINETEKIKMENIIKSSASLLLAEGIFLILSGITMVYLSQTTTIFFAFLLSIGLLFLGIYKTINNILLRKELKTPVLAILSGILLSAIGLYLIFNPIFNTIFLTLTVAIYLILESINSFSNAFLEKKFKQNFWLGIFAGIIQILLGIIIITGLPYTATWVIGMIMGINFIFAGMNSIILYNTLKHFAY